MPMTKMDNITLVNCYTMHLLKCLRTSIAPYLLCGGLHGGENGHELPQPGPLLHGVDGLGVDVARVVHGHLVHVARVLVRVVSTSGCAYAIDRYSINNAY